MVAAGGAAVGAAVAAGPETCNQCSAARTADGFMAEQVREEPELATSESFLVM